MMVQVGERVITYADLQDEARYWRLAEVDDDRMERLFFALIDRMILLEHMRFLPRDPEDEDRAKRAAEEVIRRFEQRYGGVEGLHATVTALDWDLMRLRAFLEARSLQNSRIRRLVMTHVEEIEPEDLLAFEAERREAGLPTAYYTLRQIVIGASAGLSEQEARAAAEQRAAEALLAMRSGETFEAVAKVYSDDPLTAMAGGYVGTMTDRELRPELAAALRRVPTGGVSEAVRVGDQWVIAQVLDRRSSTQMLAARRFREGRRALFSQVRPDVPIRFIDQELKDLGFEERYRAYAERMSNQAEGDAAAEVDEEEAMVWENPAQPR